jgi:anaphase-promoting complex subunit 10
MSGKDTHVRGLRVLGPIGYVLSQRDKRAYSQDFRDSIGGDDPFSFQTPAFKMFETIR